MKGILEDHQPNWTFIKEETCECGQTVQVYKMEIIGGPNKGKTKTVKRNCRCDEYDLANQALKRRDQLIAAQMHKLFEEKSMINAKLMKKDFSNFDPGDNRSQMRAKKVMEQYTKIFNPENPKSVYLTGKPGLGKSHLAVSVAHELKDKGYSAIFISVPKLLRKIKATFNDESKVTEDQIFTALERVDLLILDDVGAERQTEWTIERVFDLIDSRSGKNNIYTSNLNKDELMTKYGERDGSRILDEETHIEELTGVNYRTKDLL